MLHTLIIFVGLFICAYALPSIILAILQIRHIKAELQKPAILLESEDYHQAGEYAIASLRLDIINRVLEIITFILWVSFGFSLLQKQLDIFMPHSLNPIWQSVALVLSFMLISSIIELPLSIYKTFGLDKKFGFSKQTPKLFIIDLYKHFLLSLIVGGLIVFLLIFIIEKVVLWWIVGFIVLLSVVILANFVYPTLDRKSTRLNSSHWS